MEKRIPAFILAMVMIVNLFATEIVKASVLEHSIYQGNGELLQVEDMSSQRTNNHLK